MLTTRNSWLGRGVMLFLFAVIIILSHNAIYNYTQKQTHFTFVSFKIDRIDGKLYLKLHRTLAKNIVGGFYVTIYNQKTSCSASKPYDVFESARSKPYWTRFISRFDSKCLNQLITNHGYSVDVTYKILNQYFTRTVTNVKLNSKDLNRR